jgi:ankyrin repeat protein
MEPSSIEMRVDRARQGKLIADVAWPDSKFPNDPKLHENARLVVAAQNGDIETVKSLLLMKDVIDVNMNIHNIGTPILCACLNGHTAVVDLLITAGADNLANALYIACQCEHVETVKLLLSRVNRESLDIAAALKTSCKLGHITIVRQLVTTGADMEMQSNYEALHIAFIHKQYEVVKFLLDHGEYVNTCTAAEETTLFLASESGDAKVVELLLTYPHIEVDSANKKGQTPLWVAIQNGHWEIAEKLLKTGANPNAMPLSSMSPLQIVSLCGNFAMVELLIKYKADVNLVIPSYCTALENACNARHINIAELLLKAGADPNLSSGIYFTALSGAVGKGWAPIAELLLKYNTNPNVPKRYCSPLCCAIAFKQCEMVELLLTHKADPNIVLEDDGTTPLIYAIKIASNISIIRALLIHGANPNALCTCLKPSAAEMKISGTALGYAALYNAPAEVFHLLFEYKADPNLGDIVEGNTALFFASPKVTELLISHGANPNAVAKNGATPLVQALVNNDVACVTTLLAHGARPDALVEKTGQSIIVSAIDKNSTEMVVALLRGKVDPNVISKDGAGVLPLCLSIRRGLFMITLSLLEYGADPNKCDAADSPLRYAIKMGDKDMAEKLLTYGADPDQADMRTGQTPLHLTLTMGNSDLVPLLLKFGANPNIARWSDGSSPITMATASREFGIVTMLKEYGARHTYLSHKRILVDANDDDGIVVQKNKKESCKCEVSMCKVCLENPITVLCEPCRHACMCKVCSLSLSSDSPLCPICRTKISKTIEFYLC